LDLAIDYPRTAERIGLGQACGRVLAETVSARWDIPSFDQSAMDGFALRAADLADNPLGLPISATIFAGQAPDQLAPGTAARIMTGAAIPAGADTVIAFEQADDRDGRLRAQPTLGTHIRRQGEDVRAGVTILTPGTVLTARHIGALAAVGRSQVQVARRPKVAVLTTGDELLSPDQTPTIGTVIDSNGPFLAAALVGLGADLGTVVHCGDDPARFTQTMNDLADNDLILVTGGVSTGDKDVTRAVLSANGSTFVLVKMQPGKPQGAGRWGQTPVLALPGNPVSVAVSVAVFVRPLIHALLGTTPPPSTWATVAQGWTSPADRRQYFPVRFTDDGQIAPATPGGAGSHLVTSLAQATAFAIIEEPVTKVLPNTPLEVIPIN
jgi:molybdopterin molybdotransferase